MSFTFNWHIPAGGDGRWLCQRQPERPPRIAYLQQVAQAAEAAGFDRVLVPCSFSNGNHSRDAPYVDAWTLGVACLAATTTLGVTIAHRPGFVNPGVFAQMCAAADELGRGRLALNIVTAGAPGDMEQYGDTLEHGARYRRAGEFVSVLKELWTQPATTHHGEFYELVDARLSGLTVQERGPEIHLVGASPAAVEMAAEHADVYMLEGVTVEEVASRIAQIRELAAGVGRTPRFCVAATVFAAADDEAARAKARQAAEHADLAVVAERRAQGRMTSSVEDVRLRHNTNLDTWLTPHIWAGVAHLLHGTAWVGSYESIAELFCEYAAVGVSSFQMFGYPYLEEARHIGEHLLPVARRRLADAG